MQDGQSSKQSSPEWLPLAALIALAIVLRVPLLVQLDEINDWLTSHTVLVTRIWQMTGLAANHFSLGTNWPNPADPARRIRKRHGVRRRRQHVFSVLPSPGLLSFLRLLSSHRYRSVAPTA